MEKYDKFILKTNYSNMCITLIYWQIFRTCFMLHTFMKFANINWVCTQPVLLVGPSWEILYQVHCVTSVYSALKLICNKRLAACFYPFLSPKTLMDWKNSFPAFLNLSTDIFFPNGTSFKIEYCSTGKTLHRLKANLLCCEKQNKKIMRKK